MTPHTHITPGNECPSCGRKTDRATGWDHTEQPKEGSVVVCNYCAAVSIFGKDMTLRAPTLEDEVSFTRSLMRQIKHARLAIMIRNRSN